MRRIRVGVIFGGRSGEHEVSLLSARSVMGALDPAKYEVVPIGISREGKWLAGGDPMRRLQAVASEQGRLLAPGGQGRSENGIAGLDDGEQGVAEPGGVTDLLQALVPASTCQHGGEAPRIDVVFPVLHGPYGEDGTIQGLLEMAGIPYVGAGVLGSALGMDKAVQKTLLRACGLPVVDWLAFTRRRWSLQPQVILEQVESSLSYPCFSKPANLGSSVGVTKVSNREELVAGIHLAGRYDRKILVEQAAVNCREIECSVLGNDDPIASLPGEVRPGREFYDYVAKYISDDTELIIPADLPTTVTEQVRQMAIKGFQAIDCSGMARVDFFVAQDYSRIYVNEVNTIPGFTAISMYPKLWEASGLSYSALVDRLVALALERHDEKRESEADARAARGGLSSGV